MIRLRSLNFLIAGTALVFLVGSVAMAQTKKRPKHARTAPAAQPRTPAKAREAAPGSTSSPGLGFGVAESLSGTIQIVVPDQNLLVVNGPNGVPYDLKVSPKTVIVVGEKAGTLASLSGLAGKPVSVGFVPQRDGDIATRVEVSP